jgi:uncharacterized membrane protein
VSGGADRSHGPPGATRPELPIEIWISRLLRAGLAVSLCGIAVGTLISFIRHPDYLYSARALERLTAPGIAPHQLEAVLDGLARARGQALVMVGLLFLIATPVLRVALSVFIFLRERDRPMLALTLAVLILLLLSIAIGRAGAVPLIGSTGLPPLG